MDNCDNYKSWREGKMETDITVAEAMELLFNPESLRTAIKAEEDADCDVSAGLDWGNERVFVAFLKNPALLGRMTSLRLSLNREIKLLLAKRNLGAGGKAAIVVARELLLSRLQLPSHNAIPVLESVLMRDDLYEDKFIQNHKVLRDLLNLLLGDADWEEIATAAGHAIREQVLLKLSC